MDKRVMTLPFVIRWMIVSFFIAPFRPHAIAGKYASIWEEDGFPLITHGQRLAEQVSQRLGDDVMVQLAMRYGTPGILQSLERFRMAGIGRLLVVPLFPQYASATSGSIVERVIEDIKTWRAMPELMTISSFYDHPRFIDAWVSQASSRVSERIEHLLFSFHGLPESHIREADPTGAHCLESEECCRTIGWKNRSCYRAQCYATAHAIARAFKLDPRQYSISFQSRLGRAKWLEPYTIDHVKVLAQSGIKRLTVCCPSFVADCLETTEEIEVEVQAAFRSSGGEALDLIPSLNSSQSWVEALSDMVREKLPQS